MKKNNPMTTETMKMIDKIYRENKEQLKWFFFCSLADEMKAEDMVQDAFMRLLTYTSFINEETVKSLLFTIARSMIIDHARHLAYVRKAAKELSCKIENYEYKDQTVEFKEIENLELCRLHKLPKKQARVYEMYRYEGKDADHIANELCISKRTVEFHLRVSRKSIRQYVAHELQYQTIASGCTL